jgi:hypothetical protein
MRSPP